MNTVGDAVSAIALPLIAFTVLHGSAFSVAALMAVEQGAWLLIGLPAGVWIDRWSRKRVIVLNSLARGVVLATIPLAWWIGILSLFHLFVVAGLTGITTVFSRTASGAYLPSLVAKGRLVAANGRLATVLTAADMAGQAAAGFLIELVRAPVALAVEAVMALGSALFVRSTRERTRVITSKDNRKPSDFWRELNDGWKFTLNHTLFRTMMFANIVWNFATAGQFAIAVPFLVESLDAPDFVIGLVFSVAGIGGVVGAVLSGKLVRKAGSGRVWRWALIVGPILGLLVPASSTAPGYVGIAMFGIGLALLSLAISLVSVVASAARQATCPPAILGRLGSVNLFLSWGVIPLGAMAFGALGSWINIPAAMWLSTVTMGACVAIAKFGPLRNAVELEGV